MQSIQPKGFFSYARKNDEADDEALSRIHIRLEQEISGKLGYLFRLFRDRRDLPTGVPWAAELDDAVDQSSIFLPVITPYYLRSQACQHEFERFLARERELQRNDLIFPLYYLECPELTSDSRLGEETSAIVVAALKARQREDWRSLRVLLLTNPDALEVRQNLIALASSIVTRFRRLQERPFPPSAPKTFPTQGVGGTRRTGITTRSPRSLAVSSTLVSSSVETSSVAPDILDHSEFAQSTPDPFSLPRPLTFRAPFDSLLLPSPSPFVGREREQRWLLEALHSDTPSAVVHGMSGIGKRKLVARVIADLDFGATFPDGIVVFTREADDPAIDDRLLVHELIRRISIEGNFPISASWEQTVETLQRLLLHRQLLTVFDGLPSNFSLARLIPLLQRLRCGVIIITERLLTPNPLPAMRHLTLQGLPMDDSVLLFRQAFQEPDNLNISVAPHVVDGIQEVDRPESFTAPFDDGAAIQRIAALVDGHPLALEVVARYTAAIGLDITEVAEELQNAGQVLHLGLGDTPPTVLTALRRGYEALPPQAQSLFTAFAAGDVNEFGRGVALALLHDVTELPKTATPDESRDAPTQEDVFSSVAPQVLGVSAGTASNDPGANLSAGLATPGLMDAARRENQAASNTRTSQTSATGSSKSSPASLPQASPLNQSGSHSDALPRTQHEQGKAMGEGLTNPLLDLLIARSFVVQQVDKLMVKGIQRYRLRIHPLLFALACDGFKEWPQVAQGEAHRGVSAFYAQYVERLGDSMEDPTTPPQEADAKQSQATLAADQAPMLAALRWVDSDDGHSTLGLQTHDQLLEALCGGLQFRWRWTGRYEEARHWLPRAIAATERRIEQGAGAPVRLALRLAHFYFTAASADIEVGHFQQADEALAICLALRQRNHDRVGQAAALHRQGQVAEWRGNMAAARSCYTDSLHIARAVGSRHAEAVICASRGHLDLYTYHLPEAKSILDESEQVARQIGLDDQLLSVLHLQGRLALLYGELERAQSIFADLRSRAELRGDRIDECSALHELGQVAIKRGELNDALSLYRQAQSLAQSEGSPRWQAIVANALGNAELVLASIAPLYERPRSADLRQSALLRAQTYFTQSLHVARDIHDRRMEGTQLTLLGLIAWMQEQQDLAESYLVTGLALAESVENQDDIGIARETLGRIALQRHQREEARHLLVQSLVSHRLARHFDAADQVEALLQTFGRITA
ncbi:MAG TPA: TIR domain-containing protein [Ktedonobacterales bacterium]|nr:TIR domain-containing protein [Ktedonobacterales bacterium]